MPDIDGLETIQRIVNLLGSKPKPRIYLLTGADLSSLDSAPLQHVLHVYQKPLRMDVLRQVLQ